MASALVILFLGCWLAGQSRVSGGGTNLTQLGAAPIPTNPGSVGPGTTSGSRKSPSTPTQIEETDPAGTQQLDPPTTEPEGEDAGSIPIGGTNPTQPGTMPAPLPRQGSIGPSNGAEVRKSPTTPPETDLCCPRNCFWGEPRRAGCVGRGQIPTANVPSGLRPHQTHFICSRVRMSSTLTSGGE
ncbi:uncharacterized protein ACDP82_020300 isoform 1-T1 [Pangshura tecta]